MYRIEKKMLYVQAIKNLLRAGGLINWEAIIYSEFYVIPFILYSGPPNLYEMQIFQEIYHSAKDLFLIFIHQQYLSVLVENPGLNLAFHRFYDSHSTTYVKEVWLLITENQKALYNKVKCNFGLFTEFYLSCMYDQRFYVNLRSIYLHMQVPVDLNGNAILDHVKRFITPLIEDQSRNIINVVEEQPRVEAPIIEPAIVPPEIEPRVEKSFIETWGFTILSSVVIGGLALYCGGSYIPNPIPMCH
jgi:hypothetical protein